MRISPETLYRYVYVLPRGALKQTLIKGLRHERKVATEFLKRAER